MRLLYSTALAGVLALTAASDAEAGRRSGATSEGLLFVSDTNIPAPGGGNMSLCILTETRSAFFIPFWTSAKGYGLAADRCNADKYLPVDNDMISELAGAGAISADVPGEPALTAAQTMTGSWGMGLAGALIAYGGVVAANRSKRKKQRHSAMGNTAPEAMAVLDVICHAAKADGVVEESEVHLIADIAEKITGTHFDVDTVRRMIDLSEANLQPAGFKALAKNLGQQGRGLAMQGALHVAAADGVLDGKEKQFIGGLAQALNMGEQEISGYLAALAQPA